MPAHIPQREEVNSTGGGGFEGIPGKNFLVKVKEF